MSSWTPISLDEIRGLIAESEALMEPELLRLWERIRTTPAKWRLHPWGDEGGGFWVVGKFGDDVLWYNDIEGGFNISKWSTFGTIDEYWCNDDLLHWTVFEIARQLDGEIPRPRLGAPEPRAPRPAGGIASEDLRMAIDNAPGMFDELRGRQLSAVTFVMDSLQLWFDGISITVTNPLTVESGESAVTSWQPGFRDALCAQIAQTVTAVEVRDKEALILHFRYGARVAVSLREEDYTTPEALCATGFSNGAIVVV